MWLEDFQKGLEILKIVRNGLDFKDDHCFSTCAFITGSLSHCRLFNVHIDFRDNILVRPFECRKMFDKM